MAHSKKQPTLPEALPMAGYVRVSTPMQVARGESLDVQEQRLREEAKRRGWELVLYREPGISAKDENRPLYQQMRADLEAGRVVGVVVTKLDRLWRNFRLAINEAHTICQEWGRELVTLDAQFDTTTPTGRAVRNILSVVAELEREMTAERVRETMQARAQQGKFNGGPIPYGYRLVEKGRLVIDEAEAETVRQMFDLFLEKGTVRGVCHALNESGKCTRQGHCWANQTIRRILSSSLYAGELVYNRRDTSTGNAKLRPDGDHIRVANAVPAIISLETFTTAQEILKSRPLLAPRAQASDYLLAGLVKCELCRGNMAGHATWGRGRKMRHRYYRCYNYTQKGRTACQGSSVKANALEHLVLESLFDLRINPDKLRALEEAQQARERAEVAPLRREVARLERELTNIAVREDRIMLAYEEKAYSATEMKQRKAQAAADRAKLEATLEKEKSRLADATLETFDVEFIVSALETVLHLYYKLSFEKRRRLLHALIDQVVVGHDGGYYTLKGLGKWDGLLDGDIGQRVFITYPLVAVLDAGGTAELDSGLREVLLKGNKGERFFAEKCWNQILELRDERRISLRNQTLARAGT